MYMICCACESQTDFACLKKIGLQILLQTRIKLNLANDISFREQFTENSFVLTVPSSAYQSIREDYRAVPVKLKRHFLHVITFLSSTTTLT